jgi:hypothetical protein
MRKKTDKSAIGATTGVSNKVITKPPRPQTSTTPVAIPRKNQTHPTDRSHKDPPDAHTLDNVNDDCVSAATSRDRSPTPLESDLLRYLTAHITPIQKNEYSDFYIGVTSFVIGRDEYLQGIVRLVQSDCPEVAGDMKCFVDAMQQAFVEVKNTPPVVII